MLKNKTVVKIISVVLAVILWAYVIGEVNPVVKKTIDEIPVELTNVESLEERGLALQSDEEYQAIIVVKGSRSDLNALKMSDIHVTADMFGYTKGENHVSLEVSLPGGISLEELRTPEITVILEDLDEKRLPVTVEFTGKTEGNLEPTWASVVPAEVEVRGAASVVEKVDSVRVKLDVDDLSETWDVYTETPTAWTKKDKQIKNVTISAQTVEVEAVMHHTKQVPLELKVTGRPDKNAGDAEVTIPDQITVKGNTYALRNVTEISAGTIDISNVTESTTIKISANLPDGVLVSDSDKDIGVKIEFK